MKFLHKIFFFLMFSGLGLCLSKSAELIKENFLHFSFKIISLEESLIYLSIIIEVVLYKKLIDFYYKHHNRDIESIESKENKIENKKTNLIVEARSSSTKQKIFTTSVPISEISNDIFENGALIYNHCEDKMYVNKDGTFVQLANPINTSISYSSYNTGGCGGASCSNTVYQYPSSDYLFNTKNDANKAINYYYSGEDYAYKHFDTFPNIFNETISFKISKHGIIFSDNVIGISISNHQKIIQGNSYFDDNAYFSYDKEINKIYVTYEEYKNINFDYIPHYVKCEIQPIYTRKPEFKEKYYDSH